MKFCFIKSDKNEVIVYAEEESGLVDSIKQLCESESELVGYFSVWVIVYICVKAASKSMNKKLIK